MSRRDAQEVLAFQWWLRPEVFNKALEATPDPENGAFVRKPLITREHGDGATSSRFLDGCYVDPQLVSAGDEIDPAEEEEIKQAIWFTSWRDPYDDQEEGVHEKDPPTPEWDTNFYPPRNWVAVSPSGEMIFTM